MFAILTVSLFNRLSTLLIMSYIRQASGTDDILIPELVEFVFTIS